MALVTFSLPPLPTPLQAASVKMASPNVTPPEGVPEAPPPWTLEAESWLFTQWTSTAQMSANNQAAGTDGAHSETLHAAGLDAGSFHPLEVLHDSMKPQTEGKVDTYRGGLGAWMLYRYTDSPVGPYDEIIYIAGEYSSPSAGLQSPRITNIYVSTDESIWNGRRNWNICKHKAVFKWSHAAHDTSLGVRTVSISHPSDSPLDSSKPFFSARLNPTTKWTSWLPSLPRINTAPFPALNLVSQPLLHGAYPKGARGDEVTIATEPGVWRATAPTFAGRPQFATVEPALEGEEGTTFGDGVSFPKLTRAWRTGVHFPNVTVSFPAPTELGPGVPSQRGSKKNA